MKSKRPIQPPFSRRKFLEFMGRSGIALAILPVAGSLSSCAGNQPEKAGSALESLSFPIKGIAPSSDDKLLLAEGLQYHVIASYDQPISEADRFGEHCDFTAFVPLNDEATDGLLWVNNEYLSPNLMPGYEKGKAKTKAQVEQEMYVVGGSIIRIKKDTETGQWKMVFNDPFNRRLNGFTEIPLIAERPIAGSLTAIGTMGNCCGGVTPWGNILSCEENYQDYYGELVFDKENPEGRIEKSKYAYHWENFYHRSPAHYGWVVEVNTKTGEAKKLTSLGRFAHESATVWQAKDQRCVVYTGDDKNDEHLYKFIADQPGSLEKGRLYVANLETGKWIPLVWAEQPLLQEAFSDQTEVLIRAREAALLLGATPLDRPEDIVIDHATGSVIVALTNNKPKGNYFGSLLRIAEKNGDPLSLEFKSSTLITGGEEAGFACPDNLAFDPAGNLWIVTDMSGSEMNQGPYEPFKNNGLFVVPMSGPDAGKPIQVGSAPTDAEFTGPCFSPDGRTLFLSVQHPGEQSDPPNYTSHWPNGEGRPLSSVIAISGTALDRVMQG